MRSREFYKQRFLLLLVFCLFVVFLSFVFLSFVFFVVVSYLDLTKKYKIDPIIATIMSYDKLHKHPVRRQG